jgi:sensor histidine kinase regulating citrate/malate metabolism
MFGSRANRRIAEYQNELMSRHCGEVENIYRQMRAWRHDYLNHIQAIKAYIAMGQIGELEEYCDALDQDLQSVDLVIKTGSVMLDAILNSKLSLAKAKGIEVFAKASVPKALSISDVDLCVLIGNLLDNATEACARGEKSEGAEIDRPFIRVYVGMRGSHLYLCVTNAVFGKVKREGARFLSTKDSPTHGFGLLRVDGICKKYGGYVTRASEPGAFTTEILLPVG